MTNLPPTPELNKIAKIAVKSQAIGEFLDWLFNTKELRLGVIRECNYCNGSGELYSNEDCKVCEGLGEVLSPRTSSIQILLNKYFEIDEDRAEKEREALLEHIRKQST